MNEIKNYGLQLSPLEDLSAYRLGAIELPKLVLRRDGQYDNYLPEDELQHTPSFDTYGCTVYGTENIQQTMERVHGLESKEYDERYNYNLAKIVPPGADPHVVSDIFRLNGVVSGVFPMVGTLAEYATPRPMPSKYVSQGVAHPHELRHQWLWSKPISKEERIKLIKEYLQYSPLGVSVTAWSQENGVYVDKGQPNTHWTMLYGYNDKGWKIYDSYFPHRKILSYDHNIQVCKRYILVPNTRQKQISILQQLIEALKKLLGLKEKELSTPPVITPPKPELPPLQALKWSTPTEARHSVRVLCDMEGLSVPDKNVVCAVVGAESGWKINAVGKNTNGSIDYSLCQFNDGPPNVPSNKKWWIGEGKSFSSPQDVFDNPERQVRIMISEFKRGNLKLWNAYKNGSFVKFL